MESKSQKNIESILDTLYAKIHRYHYQDNAGTLLNIITLKARYGISDYHQTMYVDAKYFITNYIQSINNSDYGYDSINVSKIIRSIENLDNNKKISLLYYTKRVLNSKGYGDEISEIDEKIGQIKINTAIKNREYFKAFRIWISQSIKALLLTLFAYSIITTIIMLPAPLSWMEIFRVHCKTLSSNGLINCFLNSLLFITGDDTVRPIIEPTCPLGVIVHVLIISFFYFTIINYVLRRIEDYMNKK